MTGTGQRHYTIPIFIPGVACPFQCIFCDQEKITGRTPLPSSEAVEAILSRHLKTIPEKDVQVEAGFFGGTFTGLPAGQQQEYLEMVRPYLRSGRISSIRISTRPDFITEDILDLLKRNQVGTIELGAQSMDDEVLRLSLRGHSVSAVESASGMVLAGGFRLGLQMMVGLPGDTEEKVTQTAEKIVALGAAETRIYPVLVIAGTMLERMYRSGEYKPLELNEAVRWTRNAVRVFDQSGVKILRIGLHPSEELTNQGSLVAGPFHPSFRELVMTEIWSERFRMSSFPEKMTTAEIHVNPEDYNNAVGYSAANRKYLETMFKKVRFIGNPGIPHRQYHAYYR